MGSWSDVEQQIKAVGAPHDVVRREALASLAEYTGRSTILYYSGWLEKEMLVRHGLVGIEVNDADKNGFMSTIHGLDRSTGLDLILHTPGGSVAATESIVDYLHAMFGNNIRVIVPQLAMSAGTMIALSSREVVMGKHSSLGPIDPQLGGVPAHGIVEEFETARAEITANQAAIPLWQPIIAKYSPTLVGECFKAIKLASEMVTKWLIDGMFAGEADAEERAKRVVDELGSHALTLSHERHLSASRIKELGVNVTNLEDDPKLQDLVLTVHHCSTQTVTETAAFKIIENHMGQSYISAANARAVPAG